MTQINLHMIVPATMTDAVLSSSTVPETDYAAWANATGYVIGDTRIIVSTNIHWVIQCIQAHTSALSGANDPLVDINRVSGAGVFWLRVSSTNRWKSFDQKINDQTAFNGNITHTLIAPAAAGAVAAFNVTANEVRLTVTNTATAAVRTVQTLSAIETGGVVDWWTYFYNPIEYKSEVLFPLVPIYAGDTVEVRVSGLATNRVGEIAWGRDLDLGRAIFPLNVGIIDYSTKDRDTFGNPYITPRAFASRAEYRTQIRSTDGNRIKRQLAAVRAVPVIFYTHTDDNNFGSMVYGYVKSFDVDEVAPNVAYLSLQVEGLI